jgi:hypothetical protein
MATRGARWAARPLHATLGVGREQPRPTVERCLPAPATRARFIAEVGRCWQNVYDRNMQATHCPEPPSWTGRWRSPRGDQWWIDGPVPITWTA